MTTYHEAIHLDIAEQIVPATVAYEAAIQAGDAPLDAYLNLAVLYWSCWDYGFVSGHHLDLSFRDYAAGRYEAILEQALERYPAYPESRFWQLYCRWVYIDDDPHIAEIKELVKDPYCSLVPYFHLFLQEPSEVYRAKVRALALDIAPCRTEKNRYVLSMIESDL